MPSTSTATVAAPAEAAAPAQPPTAEARPARPVLVRLPDDWDFSDAAMLALWKLNPQWDIEVTEAGELSIMPGTGWDNSELAAEIIIDVGTWRRAGGGGRVAGADGMVRFPPPSRAMMAPDVSWVSDERAAQPGERHETVLIPVCPDFVVEIRSESDDPQDQREKMQRWIEYGVRLGWLIDRYEGQVWIYREGQAEPALLAQPERLEGEDVLEGLVVELGWLWESE